MSTSKGLVNTKNTFFIFFALCTLFVALHNELPFLDSNSPIWQHFAKVKWWLLPHALGGTIALLIGPTQFSNRIRQAWPAFHRMMGRLYVVSALIAAPTSIYIGYIQGTPALFTATIVQSFGWVSTTLIGLYCIRRGNIAQHREWMLRSYPFAMIFVFARIVLAIPVVARAGINGVEITVWTMDAAAYFIPTVVLNWKRVFSTNAPRTKVGQDPGRKPMNERVESVAA